MKTEYVPQPKLTDSLSPTILEHTIEVDPQTPQDNMTCHTLGTIVTMQVCPDGQTPCAAPNYCAMPGNGCYNGIYKR